MNKSIYNLCLILEYPDCNEEFKADSDDFVDLGETKEGFSPDLKILHSSTFFTHTFCELSADELPYFIKKIHRDFYWRPSYIISWFNRIKGPRELFRVIKASLKVVDFLIRGAIREIKKYAYNIF